ncbi:phage portal protein [Priestia megaterium]
MTINEKLFAEIVNDQIVALGSKRADMKKFTDYYKGNHSILYKEEAGLGSPDNRLVFNFCELVIDVNHSYLFSKPYSMDLKDKTTGWFSEIRKTDIEKMTEDYINELHTIYHFNNEENITSMHGKISGITGQSVELHYIDSAGNIRFVDTKPEEWSFFKYQGEEYAMRYYKTTEFVAAKGATGYEKKEIEKAELYNNQFIFYWEKDDRGWNITNQQEHFYGEIPVIVFENRDPLDGESVSDLKNITILNDAYNDAASNLANVLSYNGDPFLVLKNFGLDEEGIEKIKDTRIIEIFSGGADADADIRYLQWDHNVDSYEKLLDRLFQNIFVLSFTPDLFTKQQGTANSDSGVALKMKFVGADLKSQQKESSFKKGLRKRLRLIAKMLEERTLKGYYTNRIFQNISLTFNRNMPQNLTEIVDNVVKLAGTVSEETRIKLLPFVPNAAEEAEKVKNEDMGVNSLFGEVNNNGSN